MTGAEGADTSHAPHTAFVLGGGGRWGAVELGMIRALVDADIRPDLILGASIGAFNGAVFAADPTRGGIATLQRLWASVAADDLLGARLVDRARMLMKLRVAIQDPEPLRQVLDSVLPVSQIEDLEVPFQCVAASIERAAEHWFERGPLIDSLLASAAEPALPFLHRLRIKGPVPVTRRGDLDRSDLGDHFLRPCPVA